MFAHAAETDIPDQYDLVVLLRKELLRVLARVLRQAAEHLGVYPGHAGGCFHEPFAVGIFADRGEDFAHRPLDARKIDGRQHGAVADDSARRRPISATTLIAVASCGTGRAWAGHAVGNLN